MKTRSATRSVALRCPAETQNPHKRRLCKMSARAGLASYGRGYLQHNAGNCLNMAMGVRGGVLMLRMALQHFCLPSSPAGEGGLCWRCCCEKPNAPLKTLAKSEGQNYLLLSREPGT